MGTPEEHQSQDLILLLFAPYCPSKLFAFAILIFPDKQPNPNYFFCIVLGSATFMSNFVYF